MSSASLFDFIEPDGSKIWIATPGIQTAFPISIRNNTPDGHEVALRVEEPANWAWATPERISLDPGASTTVSVILSPHPDTLVAAGTHESVLRLRDLEGVIFAECRHPFEIQERQELAMTVTLRGPLMSFGLAEGVVLHCTLANRGNVDVAVTPVGDPHPTLTFSKRTVQVPFQGEASFDIEVRWNAARRLSHPDIVTLRAPYRNGEATASIEWHYIAEALERFMPIYSTRVEEDEVLSLSWMPNPDVSQSKPLLQSVPPPIAVPELPAAAPQSPVAAPQPPVAAPQPQTAPLVRPAPAAQVPAPPKPAVRPPAVATVVSVVKHPPNVTAIVTTTAAAAPAAVTPPPQAHVPPTPDAPRSRGRTTARQPLAGRSAPNWLHIALPILLLLIAMEALAIGWQAHNRSSSVQNPGAKALSLAGQRAPNVAHAAVLRAAPRPHHAVKGAQHKTSANPRAATAVRPQHTAAPSPSPTQPPVQPKAIVKAKSRSQAVKPAQPFSALPASLSALSAYYAEPHLLIVSFVRSNIHNVRLTVHDGAKVLYDRRGLDGHTATIHLSPHIKNSLQITVVGSAPAGSVVFRQMWLYRPPWL
ncbi:MAG: COG1470 family protein [Candidatus Eremiobacter antarcticus]